MQLVPDQPPAVPVTVQLNNKSGGTSGTVEAGDSYAITYSEPMAVNTLCAIVGIMTLSSSCPACTANATAVS